MSATRRLIIAFGGLLLAVVLWIVAGVVHTEPSFNRSREGSWYFPRGGPYILGFQSKEPAKLFVDEQLVAEGKGVVSGRRVFEPGVHSFRLEGHPRLLWHPPGRRGALEYVPDSSLWISPGTPRFENPGTSRSDGFFAFAILAVIAATLLALFPPRLTRQEWTAFGAIFLVALAIRWWGLGDAGQTWDEDEYWSSGRNYLVNWINRDFSEASWRWNFEHPPMTKYLAGLGALWQDGYGVARALFAAVGAATCAIGAAVGVRLFGWRAGLFAGLVLAFTPHLIGHAQIVGHETPSVFFATLTVLCALRVHDDGVVRAGRLVVLGLVLGLAVATRYTNLLLFPVAAVILLVQARGLWKRTLGLGLGLVPITALLAFAAVWPRMWNAPIRHLDESWQKLRQPHALEPYLGQATTDPAWHYFFLYTLVVTPLLIGVLAFAGGAWRGAVRREGRSWIVLAVWLVAPYVVGFSPVRQDGVRYVLAVLVPLGVLAGAGLDHAVEQLRLRHAPLLAGGVLTAYLAVSCLLIRPYYIDYYNEAVGPERAQRQRLFEVGWWGEGIADAVDYVNRHAAKDARLFKAIDATHVGWFRADLFNREVSSAGQAEWVVVNDAGAFARRLGAHWVPGGFDLVHDVRAGGASLVRVYRRSGVLP